METSEISLIISGVVGAVTVFNVISTLLSNSRTKSDKLAKVDDITNCRINEDLKLRALKENMDDELDTIKDNIRNHDDKINDLTTDVAVVESQMDMQLKAVGKIFDKIDELGK